MTRMQRSTPTRRTLLSVIGTGIGASLIGPKTAAGNRAASEYVLAQDGRCVPIRPLRGEEPVEAFYDYQLPAKFVSDENGASTGDDAPFASAGTMDLQRAQTSIAFLYRGPEQLSLVVVHGSVENPDAGAVTFRLSGLPSAGEWLVKDDFYRDPDTGERAPTNHDRWAIDGTDHRIDWTWRKAGADGGAFGGLGDDFELVIDPAFNQAATLYDEHYEGTVTDWEFLSGSTDSPERIALDMGEPIRIATGRCGGERKDEGESDEEADETSEGYAVCHKPPGNPDNAHTIYVGSESAVEAHLEHGDTRGPCSGDG